MLIKAGLKVRSLILMDNISFSQSIDHGNELWKLLFSFLLAGNVAEPLDHRSRGFVIIPVVPTLLFVRTDPFFC